MPQSILEMAKDLVQAQTQNGAVEPEKMIELLKSTVEGLTELSTQSSNPTGPGAGDNATPKESMDWRHSIKKNSILCLEFGQEFKQLSARHLKKYGLTPKSYRQKYGIPMSQPLSAKSVTKRRQQLAQRIRPWEKAPTYRKSQPEAEVAVADKKVSAKRKRTPSVAK